MFLRDLDLFLETIVLFLEVAKAIFQKLLLRQLLLLQHGLLELAGSFHLGREVFVFGGQRVQGQRAEAQEVRCQLLLRDLAPTTPG